MGKRRLIKVVKIRLADAEIGDVVNRDASSDEGWFEVAAQETLFNGQLQVSDETTYITITGGLFDTIAVQIVTEVELPTQPGRPERRSEDHHGPAPASEKSRPPQEQRKPVDKVPQQLEGAN